MDPEMVLKEQVNFNFSNLLKKNFQRQRLDAERREQQIKFQQQEKKYDHNVRSFHLEEMKIRKQLSDEKRAAAPALFDAYEEYRVKKAE